MAGKKDESDVAFEVKTAFYLGNFQQCISAVQKVKVRTKMGIREDNWQYLMQCLCAAA